MPSILYLDEPTSGLDSAMALDFVKAIRRFASFGCTVVCTIHQPTETIFMMFEKLLIVGDGFPRYIGSPDGALAAIGDEVANSDRNPAELLMEYVQKENKKDLSRTMRLPGTTRFSTRTRSK